MLRFGKQRGKVVAIADVGSGSVGVGIAEISSEGHAHVLVSERASLPPIERSSDAIFAGTIALLEETAQKVLKTYGALSRAKKHVDGAYAVVHAPWVHSKTIRAESRLPVSTRIDSEMIAELARGALRGENEMTKDTFLEAGVIRVELNGYPTLKPVGKYATHIAASSLFSRCEAHVREGIAGALAKIFACPPPTLRSDTRALLSVTRESASLPKEALIVNMTHEATNVVVVIKGIVAKTALVQEGINTIVKRIAGDKLPEETLALIRLEARDQCDGDACESIRAAIANTEPVLAKTFGESLNQLSSDRRLPNKLILLTHENLVPWLSHFFGRIDFAQFTVTTLPFSPSPLSLDSLKDLVTFENSADTSLGIASVLVNMETRSSAPA